MYQEITDQASTKHKNTHNTEKSTVSVPWSHNECQNQLQLPGQSFSLVKALFTYEVSVEHMSITCYTYMHYVEVFTSVLQSLCRYVPPCESRQPSVQVLYAVQGEKWAHICRAYNQFTKHTYIIHNIFRINLSCVNMN